MKINKQKVRNKSPGIQKDKINASVQNLSKSPKRLPSKSLSQTKSALKSHPRQTFQTNQLQPDHDTIIQKMKQNRLRLCNTLDTYTLLIRSNNPIRCLQHNSNISIYCQTEQKLLCSNCVFRKVDHKYHKVIPVDKAQQKMSRDVEIMQRQIQRQVLGIQQVYKKIFKHYQEEQKYGQDFLEKIDRHFQTGRIIMAEWEMECKRKIVLELQKVQTKYQMVLSQLQFLKDVYRDQYIQVPPTKDSNFLLYQHAMCSTVVSQGKFAHTKWGMFINQMQSLGLKQEKKVLLIIEQIHNMLQKKKTAQK